MKEFSKTVREILSNVKRRGDEALLDYTRRLDKLAVDCGQ